MVGRLQVIATCCLMTFTPIRTPKALTAKQPVISTKCLKRKKKKQTKHKIGKKPQRQTYPPCETCGKKNHPPERCWQGAGAHLRPKRTRHDEKANDDSNDEGTSKKSNNTETYSSGQSSSKSLSQKTNFATTPNT